MNYRPPDDFQPLRTGDGSLTLRSETFDEHYHSLHGAVRESRHVFIEQGLRACGKRHVDVLEVGLGSGLNALLAWIEADHAALDVRYTAIERFPLALGSIRALEHPLRCGSPEREDGFLRMMSLSSEGEMRLSTGFRFIFRGMAVQEVEEENAFDVVYFDAFAPGKQPEMWTLDVFRRMHRALRPGGTLVTYCAKGDVRRAMLAAGFSVERLPGPPGKKEMLRATRAIDA